MKAWRWGLLALFLSVAGVSSAREGGIPPLRPMEEAEQNASSVAVLSYVAVGKEGNALSVQDFARQMHFLQSEGIRPVSADDFLAWRAGLISLPERSVLLTFEQADAAFVRDVFPVLRDCNFPFLLFVDAQKLGGSAGDLSDRDLQMMVRLGAAVGCCSDEEGSGKRWQEAELHGNEATLSVAEKELGAPARHLRALCGSCATYSYRTKQADVTMLRHLVRQGFAVAFSCTEGSTTASSPGFMLPRYMVDSHSAFARAVSCGDKGREMSIAAAMEEPRSDRADAGSVDFEDDMVAEEVEEDSSFPEKPEASEESGGEKAKDTVDEAVVATTDARTCGKLVRRAGGDWQTSHFDSPLVPREQTRVAVLGYHNFSNTKPVSEMRMRTAEFCQQMQYIRDAGLSVITMQDFIDWRFGDRCLPERCILITIDDGWKSVYTDAYPVLKAYGFPFTMFLYTRYIDVHGDSMTEAQIREMLENGATVGSHSTNHLYPKNWKKYAQESPEYARQVEAEIIASGHKLRTMFGTCSAYCYPGGYHTPPMIEELSHSPYRCAFTVIESKVDCGEDPWQVHRYMVFGTNPNIFRRAVNFDGEAGVVPTRMGIAASISRAKEFFPKAFEGLPSSKWEHLSVSGHVSKRVGKTRKPTKSPASKTKKPAGQPTPPPAPAAPSEPTSRWWE